MEGNLTERRRFLKEIRRFLRKPDTQKEQHSDRKATSDGKISDRKHISEENLIKRRRVLSKKKPSHFYSIFIFMLDH